MVNKDPDRTLKVTSKVTFRNLGGTELGVGAGAGLVALLILGPLGFVLQYLLALIIAVITVIVATQVSKALPGPCKVYLGDWFMSHRSYVPSRDPVHLPLVVTAESVAAASAGKENHAGLDRTRQRDRPTTAVV
jgi:hypothetical protein